MGDLNRECISDQVFLTVVLPYSLICLGVLILDKPSEGIT